MVTSGSSGSSNYETDCGTWSEEKHPRDETGRFTSVGTSPSLRRVSSYGVSVTTRPAANNYCSVCSNGKLKGDCPYINDKEGCKDFLLSIKI